MSIVLSLAGVSTFYGPIQALREVSLEVGEGEIVTLIGANGAGKSTLMMTICGNPRAAAGSITYRGEDITRLPMHEIARREIAQSPEGRRIFARMSVEENLLMGAQVIGFADYDRQLGLMFELFPRLKERFGQRGGTLAGGEQQMLAIARATVSRPKLIMLDEPSEGIMPVLVDEMMALFTAMRAQGTTLLLVEQNVELALGIADRAYIMDGGAIVYEAAASALLADEALKERYCSV